MTCVYCVTSNMNLDKWRLNIIGSQHQSRQRCWFLSVGDLPAWCQANVSEPSEGKQNPLQRWLIQTFTPNVSAKRCQTFPPNVSAKRFRQTRLIAVALLRNTKRQTPKPFTPNVSAKRFRQIRLNVYAKRFRQNAVKRMFWNDPSLRRGFLSPHICNEQCDAHSTHSVNTLFM